MKIAIFSDPHLGYARFEEDSYIQAERAIINASAKADLILCAGDIFDVKIPKLETLKRGMEIFGKAAIPLFAIHGNHERRAKDLVNPTQLLATGTKIKILHGESTIFEKNGERIQICGIGSVPEDYATEALTKVMERFKKEETFRVLMIHQSIKELVRGSEEELSLEYLETLPFDLIVNGHIHETNVKLGGKFIIPGSTVITQLKKDEIAPKGYFLYDTNTKKSEFVEIETRKFFYEVLEFSNTNEMEVREKVRQKVHEIKTAHPDAIVAIKIDGTLREGLTSSDVKIEGYDQVFIDNRLDTDKLSAKLEKIRNTREANLSLREMAIRELKTKTDGKVTLFDSSDLFEKLLISPEDTLEYLERFKKDSKQ